LNRGLTELDVVFSIVGPAGRVADGWVHVLESNREVDNEEVEVVDIPVRELLFSDFLDLVAVMERVPEFADEEELGMR
jgi:hypothetical protein